MTSLIDRLLSQYSASGWLIGQKSKALLAVNLFILSAVTVDGLVSLILFGRHWGSIAGDLFIFLAVSSSTYLLVRGRYSPAAAFGIVAALATMILVRALNTGTFSADSSYDITQMALNLCVVIFYAGLFAERPIQLAGTAGIALAVQLIYSVAIERVSGWSSGPATTSVIVGGFLFIGISGAIASLTFQLNRLAIDVAVRESKSSAENERRTRAIFDLSFQFIGRLTPEGVLLEANRSALDFAGLRAEDVIGKPFWETPWWNHSTESQERLRSAIVRAASGALVRYEAEHRAKDGSLRAIDFSLKPIRDEAGTITMLIPEGRDITERKRAEERLRANQEMLTGMTNNVPGSVYRVVRKATGEVVPTFVSEGAREMWGVAPEEFLRDFGVVRSRVHPGDQPSFDETALRFVELAKPFDFESRIVRPDGEVRWHRYKGRPTRQPNGDVVVDGIAIDITDQKAASLRLRESEERFRIVAEQTGRLIFECDLLTGSVIWSGAIEEVTGYSPEEFKEMDLSRWRSSIHPDDQAAAAEQFALGRLGARRYAVEYHVPRKDGRLISVEERGVYLAGPDGTATKILGSVGDITEKRETEKRLMKNETRYRTLFEESPLGLVISREGMITAVNSSFLTLMRYPDPQRVIGRHLTELVTPDEATTVTTRMAKRAQGEPLPTNVETTALRFDGSTFPCEIRIALMALPDGPATVAFVIDLTDRREAERQLRYQSWILSYVTDAIVSISSDLKIQYWNRAAERLYGYSASEAVGHTVERLLPTEFDSEVGDHLSTYLRTAGEWRGEVKQRDRNGRLLDVELSAALIRDDDGAPQGYVAVHHDITSRKLTEGALRESEERYRLLVENSTDMIVEFDEELMLQYASPQFIQTVGESPESRRGAAFLGQVHPDDQPAVRERLLEPKGSSAFRYRTSGGVWRWFDSSSQWFETGSGHRRCVVIARDITDRRAADEELRRSREQLQMFSEQLGDLMEDERKRLSREIHDELGQLLTVLKFDIVWLANNASVRSKAAVEKLASLKETVATALGSVKRIARELRPAQVEALGLAGALQYDLNIFQRKFGVRSSLTVEPEVIRLDLPRSTAMYRVFQEAMTNIVRHAGATEVQVSLRAYSGNLRLEVRDNGRGITRSEVANTRSLGLLGMKERLRSWNGSVSVTGEAGKGTLVRAVVPTV